MPEDELKELLNQLFDDGMYGIFSTREYHEVFGLIPDRELNDEHFLMTPTGLVNLKDLDKFFPKK